MAMILADFHIWDIMFVFIAVLKKLVRCLMAIGLRCLRCLMFMLSSPVEFLFLDCFIACVVSAAVIITGVDLSDLVSLLNILCGVEECVVVDFKYLLSVGFFYVNVG